MARAQSWHLWPVVMSRPTAVAILQFTSVVELGLCKAGVQLRVKGCRLLGSLAHPPREVRALRLWLPFLSFVTFCQCVIAILCFISR